MTIEANSTTEPGLRQKTMQQRETTMFRVVEFLLFNKIVKLHKYLRYGWIENLDTVRHLPLGKFWGVRVSLTPLIWLSPVVFFTLGILQNFRAPNSTPIELLYLALVYLIAVEITTLFHAFGHILGGKLVGSPMDELLLTATRGVNIYHGDQTRVPSQIHLGRALGGPVFNLLVAGMLYLLLPFIERGVLFDLMASLASTNLFFGVGAFLPLPSLDGQVIWREVFHIAHAAMPSNPDKNKKPSTEKQ